MSLKRHLSQADRTPERDAAISTLQEQILDLDNWRTEHVLEASEAQRLYKERIANAHPEYCAVVDKFEALLLRVCLEEGDESSVEPLVSEFVAIAKDYISKFSSDYQMDKLNPAWHGTVAQPGPTYFLSKLTFYVHLLCAESMGECTGGSRFGRNVAYLREEPVGGAKDANDTVSTFFDFLLGRTTPVCKQPEKYRTGYDENGPIPGACRTAQAASIPNTDIDGGSSSNASASTTWSDATPPGFVVLPEFPFSVDTLTYRHESAAELVHSHILYNWGTDNGGWTLGRILRYNRDGRTKDRGSAANFIAEYDCTDADSGSTSTYETDHNFQLNGYASSPTSVPHSWVIAVPAPQHTSVATAAFTHVKATDHLPPPGYSFQTNLPPTTSLAFKAASGVALVGRKFLQKWPQYGWCLGEITRQNLGAAQGGVNFFATYKDYPEFQEASQSFRLAEYGSGEGAEDYSWVLLEAAPTIEQTNVGWRKSLNENIQSQPLNRQAPHPLIRIMIWYMNNCTGINAHLLLQSWPCAWAATWPCMS